MTIAALYVEPKGAYFGIDGVELWDELRDARRYEGPHPVVAHPPCASWCRLAGFREALHGLPRGKDGGCFRSALAAVRTFGGVLEHPAYSTAWPAHGLAAPPREGWQATICGGWVCHVEQAWYGHSTHKATWLYAFRARHLPALRWGRHPSVAAKWGGPREWQAGERRWIKKKERKATPHEFRDLLLTIARSVEGTT